MPGQAIYYGAAQPPNSKSPFGPSNLEAQDEIVQLKPKIAKKGFLGFSLTDNLAMLITFVLPLLIFAVVYMLMSFYFHYAYAPLAWLLVFLIFAVVAAFGYVAVSRMLQDADGCSDHLAVWAAALFVGVVLAFCTGLFFGQRNYGHHTQPYYEWKQLNSYTNVDPSKMEGRAFMDAGKITFAAGTHLDTKLSTGFMNLDMYCVAPIVSAGAAPASYDFWAVGVNCCTGASQNFQCGNPVKTDMTTGGLRLLSDSELPFYKLAVTQAATKYGVKSAHPIFVHWVQEPTKAMADYKDAGWAGFVPALGLFAVFEGAVVACAAMMAMIVKSKYT